MAGPSGAAAVPAGLRVSRTASGGFRFDLPRPKLAWLQAAVGAPFLLAFMGGAAFMASGALSDAKAPGGSRVFMALFMIPFLLVPLVVFCALLRRALGRQALEADERGLVLCRRLPPLAESRRRIPLEEVTGVTVDAARASKGGAAHFLRVKTARKEHCLGQGLGRPALEWLGARVAALADAARAGAGGGRPLLEVFEADLTSDRFESGEVRAEDLARVELTAAPPAGSGVEVLEQERGVLRLRLAGRGGGFFLFFAAFWMAIVGGITVMVVLTWLGVLPAKEPPPWPVGLFLVPFWAIGIGVFLAGLRQKTLVETLDVRRDQVTWEARSALGSSARALAGAGLRLTQEVSYQQNYQPVYHLRVADGAGRAIKFAGNLKPEAQVWLLAKVGAALGPGAAELPGEPLLPPVIRSEPPPAGSGIEVLEQRGDALTVRLAGRGGRGMIVFAVVWLLVVGGITVALALGNLRTLLRSPLAAVPGLLFSLPFWAAGVALLLFGLRQATLVEEISVDSGGALWRARSVLGRSEKRLAGELRLVREVFSQSGSRVAHELRLKDSAGVEVRFARAYGPEALAWLMARLAAALERGPGGAPSGCDPRDGEV